MVEERQVFIKSELTGIWRSEFHPIFTAAVLCKFKQCSFHPHLVRFLPNKESCMKGSQMLPLTAQHKILFSPLKSINNNEEKWPSGHTDPLLDTTADVLDPIVGMEILYT